MPTPTLDATSGGASSNAYCTVAEGDTYHDSHLYTDDWIGAGTGEKTVALIMATRLLDTMIDWTGAPSTTEQALRWPRTGMYDLDGDLVTTTGIPAALRDATAEFARQLIASNRTTDSDVEAQGLTSLTAGAVSLTFRPVVPKVLPDAVRFLLVPSWGLPRTRAGAGGAVTMERA